MQKCSPASGVLSVFPLYIETCAGPTCLTTYTSGVLRTHFHGGLFLRPLCVPWCLLAVLGTAPPAQSCLAWQRISQCPTCLRQGCGWTRLPSHRVLLGPGWWTDCVPCVSCSYQSVWRLVASLTPPLRQAWRAPSAFRISLSTPSVPGQQPRGRHSPHPSRRRHPNPGHPQALASQRSVKRLSPKQFNPTLRQITARHPSRQSNPPCALGVSAKDEQKNTAAENPQAINHKPS